MDPINGSDSRVRFVACHIKAIVPQAKPDIPADRNPPRY
jgi:hypothetical protein